ncbi:MAG TPA: pyruvate kinase, partial [bacterium]|nr:pyruvate kinase [bacterium]
MRRTKIVATLGPATDEPKIIDELILAGVDMVRLNFSHGLPEDHMKRARMVREAAVRQGRHVAIMGDLQGPKIRIDRFKDGPINLEDGAPFILDAALGKDDGNQERVGLTYKQLVDDVREGDTLLLDDGRIVFTVERIVGSEIHCNTAVG